jgi:Protein of unknown function (DUF664)
VLRQLARHRGHADILREQHLSQQNAQVPADAAMGLPGQVIRRCA